MGAADGIDAVIERVSEEGLTYLPLPVLRELADAVAAVEAENIPGALVECGTALGGSAIVMAATKSRARPLRIHDVFDMIPPPSPKDGTKVQKRYKAITGGKSKGIRGATYYGYREDLLAEVTGSFQRFGMPPEETSVELVRGTFQDALHVDYPVALAHLDSDWYESTMVCLERIVPNLVPRGRLIFDDYHFWEGCRLAVDEFFEGRPGFEFVRNQRLHVVKT